MENLRENVRKYQLLFPQYSRLGEYTQNSLRQLLDEQGISINTLDYRVKKIDSFLQKIDRKSYVNPFEEMTDICGLRIVCFFQTDVKKIQEIIEREFHVVETVDKSANQRDQFGYRSKHYIVQIKEEWANTPHYRGLDNLTFEIQIRTIFMHAWAEIEHKLAYKKESHIPRKFRRKFSLLSAKLEEIDEQFEELSQAIREDNQSKRDHHTRQGSFSDDLEINLDNLQLYLDYFHGSKTKSISNTRDLLDEIILRDLNMGDLINSLNEGKNMRSDGYQTDDLNKRLSKSLDNK